MENFYEEVYQYLIERGIEDDEATEVVNHLYEANVHEYGLLTENKGKAILNMLKAVGMMSGILKTPTAKQAVKATTKRLTGTPLQGRLLTKTGKAQNFTGGRTPFTGTDPVPAASSALPQPVRPPKTSPGQMQIPGTSNKAQDLRNVTRNPNLGLPGNTSGFGGTSPLPAPKPPIPDSLSKSIQNLGRDVKPPVSKVDRVVNAVRKSALPVGATAGAVGTVAGSAALVDTANKESNARRAERQQQRDTKLAQQRAETHAASQPKPEPTGEKSAAANAEKQEVAKANAQRRRAAAADFDKAFDAARTELKRQGKDPNSGTFTWRGKSYNTKLK